ncbi:MAG: hypothetical protein JRF23_09095 [Deltaproteobacteria bacterium]|nr:hypothetical protein [Deltaproteobacteria bacterium]
MVSKGQDRLNFDAFMRRVKKGARIRSQNQLAGALGIHRSAVTQANWRSSATTGPTRRSWSMPAPPRCAILGRVVQLQRRV